MRKTGALLALAISLLAACSNADDKAAEYRDSLKFYVKDYGLTSADVDRLGPMYCSGDLKGVVDAIARKVNETSKGELVATYFDKLARLGYCPD